jgi:hypothetical protein
MKKYILLMLFCLLSKSALTQEVKDYFPLEVGNKWIYRNAYPLSGYSNSYFTGFEVTGKTIINDTVYYIANFNLFNGYYPAQYFRQDSLKNIYLRFYGKDQLFLKFNADFNESWVISNNGIFTMVQYDSLLTSWMFGTIEGTISLINSYDSKKTLMFASGYGCYLGTYAEADLHLKRAINNGKIVSPQIAKIISITYNSQYQKILLRTLAILDTKDSIVIESKKHGKLKGGLVRYSPDPMWDYNNGPNYSIESDLNLTAESDTLKITIPATLKDILGDGVDGNGNQIWEGSPTDDYSATVIILSTTNKVDNIKEIPGYKLLQNYPNPFNPSTKIQYSIPEEGYVTLKVFDMLGREVKTLVSENKKSGNYEVNFDASSSSGSLTSGVYFYKLQVNNFIESKKMYLVK